MRFRFILLACLVVAIAFIFYGLSIPNGICFSEARSLSDTEITNRVALQLMSRRDSLLPTEERQRIQNVFDQEHKDRVERFIRENPDCCKRVSQEAWRPELEIPMKFRLSGHAMYWIESEVTVPAGEVEKFMWVISSCGEIRPVWF